MQKPVTDVVLNPQIQCTAEHRHSHDDDHPGQLHRRIPRLIQNVKSYTQRHHGADDVEIGHVLLQPPVSRHDDADLHQHQKQDDGGAAEQHVQQTSFPLFQTQHIFVAELNGILKLILNFFVKISL